MGLGDSKLALPNTAIMKRLDECLIPEEKETALDYMELLQARLLSKLTYKQTTNDFRELGGLPITIRMIKKLIKDDVSCRVCCSVIEAQTRNIALMIEFIQQKGIELLRAIIKQHENDEFLMMTVPKLLKSVLSVGAKVAIKEIKEEALNLQFCQKCQETVEREKNRLSTEPEKKIPRSCDRMNRCLVFMESYPDRPDVLATGLDAAILFVRNADAVSSLHETNLIVSVFEAVDKNQLSTEVVWRACLVYAIIAEFSSDIASMISKSGVHELVVSNYYEYKDIRVQQQILWMLGAMLKWPKCKRRIQQSKKCVEFFVRISEERAENMKRAINAKFKFKPYEVVAPVNIRSFLRETGALIAPADKIPDRRPKKTFAPRRNFDEKPKFGTIDEAFKDGESGLVDENKQDNEAPWDKHLQYGATGVKLRQDKKDKSSKGNLWGKIFPTN